MREKEQRHEGEDKGNCVQAGTTGTGQAGCTVSVRMEGVAECAVSVRMGGAAACGVSVRLWRVRQCESRVCEMQDKRFPEKKLEGSYDKLISM